MHDEHEEWRPIRNRHGEETKYDVSSLGRIRTNQPGFQGNILKNGEGPDNPGTTIRRVWVTDVLKTANAPARVDVLVARAFLGEPSDGTYTVVHKNGCVWDDRADNLAWRIDLNPSTLPSTPPRTTPSIEQAKSKEKVARKAIQDGLDALAAALRELGHAEAREAAQKGVQS
jgi:hypothetical protein